MKKKFLRCISLLLAVIMLTEMLPAAWFASFLPRVYAADGAAPTETYTAPTALPTDNTITTDIPPTIVDKTGMSNASECNMQQLNAISNSSETNAPEFYIPEASEVDPQIIYFLNNASAFSQLSVEDAELLISYTGIPALSFSEMEKSGITLFDSITYASLASDARCSVSELLALDLSLNDVRPIVRELAFFNAILRDDLSDTNLAQKLRNFILLGCSCKQVFSAYGVNQVFEIPMDDLLGISADIAMPTGVSEMDIQKITSLADSFGLSASALARYAVAAGISIDEIAAKQDEFTAKQSELATELQSDGETAPSENVEDAKNFKVSAPFIYNYNEAEKIALNSGALIYECTDYVLPGANGLDLVIGRRYNSQDAFVYSPNKYSKYCAVYQVVFYLRTWREIPNRGEWDEKNTTHVLTYYTRAEAERVISLWTARSRTEQLEDGSIYHVECTAELENIPTLKGDCYSGHLNFYPAHFYNLGHGWSLQFSLIETSGGTQFLHLANGNTYEIEQSFNYFRLKDYICIAAIPNMKQHWNVFLPPLRRVHRMQSRRVIVHQFATSWHAIPRCWLGAERP